MADSSRSQTQLALYLAAALNYAGLTGAAQTFMQYARSKQDDIATRTPIAMVNAFSGQNGSYGFQIGPRLQALAAPGGGGKGPGSVLERQSFPALILLSLSKGDIEPRIRVEGGKFKVYEPYVTLHQTHRWVPLKHFQFSHGDWFKPYRWSSPSLTEEDRIASVDGLEQAREFVRSVNWGARLNINESSYLTNSLADRINNYERQLIGSVDEVKLPYEHLVSDAQSEAPTITNIVPNVVSLRLTSAGDLEPQPIIFVLQGNNLESPNHTVTAVYTNATDIAVLERSRSSITATATVTNADFPLIFQLTSLSPQSTSPLYSPPVFVRSPQDVPQVLDTEPKSVTLKRGADGTPATTNIDVVMIGSHLRRIDTNGAVIASGYAKLAGPLQPLGDGLKATVTITNAGQPIALRLPIKSFSVFGGEGSILSGPVQVDLEPPATNAPVTKVAESSGVSTNSAAKP